MNLEDKITAADGGGALVELPLGDAAPNFNLEKAVCSHGLFMMAPNHWDPHSKTFRRPLRLDIDDDGTSFMVHISHPPNAIHALHLRVFGTRVLSPQQQQSLLKQVRRMLRLSEEENKRVIDFHKVHEEAKERGFGRMFRSPTLFEDIIKCMLLCNCQWSRTLSMARALCELQAELQNPSSSSSNAMAENRTSSSCPKSEANNFAPKTPARKEPKKNTKLRRCSKKLGQTSHETEELSQTFQSQDIKEAFLESVSGGYSGPAIGNFPSPKELAKLDDIFLARRCNLGYRARRVINFAREVVEGRFRLSELEYACGGVGLTDCEKVTEKLRRIDGFGPYTCANVLMCMGYYHVVPSDSETIRHLKQVHARSSSNQTVQRDAEDIYGKYAPFQFLAYWSEMWQSYEERFGNLSEMSHSSYKLITAANMRPKTQRINKRVKLA